LEAVESTFAVAVAWLKLILEITGAIFVGIGLPERLLRRDGSVPQRNPSPTNLGRSSPKLLFQFQVINDPSLLLCG